MKPEDGPTPAEAVGRAYLLEVDLAKKRFACGASGGTAPPTSGDRLAAVTYYVTHDARLRVDVDR